MSKTFKQRQAINEQLSTTICQAIKDFKRKSDAALAKCRAELAKCQETERRKFVAPAFEDIEAQERMMRIGIEARALGATNEDEFYMIALATLQNDFVKYEGCE